MESVMMQLGGFQFRLSTAAYQELVWKTEYRWPGQDRMGRESALQFTGPGDETISLQGTVFAEFRGGRFQIEQMKAMAAEGVPQMMTDGTGSVLGMWVILEVEEKKSTFADKGVARKQDFTMKLQKFGANENAGLQTVAGIVGAVAAPLSAGAGLSAVVASGSSGALNDIGRAQAAVASITGSVAGVVNQVRGSLNAAFEAASSLQMAGVSMGQVAQIALGVSDVQGVMNYALSLTKASSQVHQRAGLAMGVLTGQADLTALGVVQAAGGAASVKATRIYGAASRVLQGMTQ